MEKSKVYVRTDERGRIIRCDGGYTASNITDPGNWVLIDEGYGDRYNLCQSNYFDQIFTEDGIPRYRMGNGEPVLRSEEELEVDREKLPAAAPSTEDRIAELEQALQMILQGVTE